jgi:hypothetical protein
MKAIRLLVAGALLATGVPAVAQVDTGQPKDATGVCKDGTFYTGKDREGACRAHGGLQEWWGTTAPPKGVPDAGKMPAADPKPAVPPASEKR